MTKKTLPALAMASSMAMLGLLPASVFAASTSPMVMLSSTATTVNAGQTVTYQVSDSAATSSTEYQFWVQSPSGQWRIGQNYSFSNSFTVHATQAGSETVVAYALSRTAVLAQDWGQALETNPDPLYVDSQVSLTVSPVASSSNPVVQVTVTAKNLMNPFYQLWWKTPAGVWEQSGGYQASSLFTVAL
ncbi:MAG: regulator, partial [Firmicutes bacterium]|nr:regulator [Bacillota bacterium]